jgi:hypothetical protein
MVDWSGVPLHWLNYEQLQYVYQDELQQFIQISEQRKREANDIIQKAIEEIK